MTPAEAGAARGRELAKAKPLPAQLRDRLATLLAPAVEQRSA